MYKLKVFSLGRITQSGNLWNRLGNADHLAHTALRPFMDSLTPCFLESVFASLFFVTVFPLSPCAKKVRASSTACFCCHGEANSTIPQLIKSIRVRKIFLPSSHNFHFITVELRSIDRLVEAKSYVRCSS